MDDLSACLSAAFIPFILLEECVMALMGCGPAENRFQQEADHILSGTNSRKTNWFTRSVQGLQCRTREQQQQSSGLMEREPIHLESKVVVRAASLFSLAQANREGKRKFEEGVPFFTQVEFRCSRRFSQEDFH